MVKLHPGTAVIVAGDRHARGPRWEDVLIGIVRELRGEAGRLVVIHGDCAGIDRMAGRIAAALTPGATVLAMPFVDGIGPAGGPIRNGEMVKVLSALRAVGYGTRVYALHDRFDQSKGTKDCATQAMAAGHRAALYRSDGTKERLNP